MPRMKSNTWKTNKEKIVIDCHSKELQETRTVIVLKNIHLTMGVLNILEWVIFVQT